MATFQKNQPVFQKPGHSPLLLLHSTREAISTAIDALKAVQDYEKFLYQAFHRLTSILVAHLKPSIIPFWVLLSIYYLAA